MAIFFIPDIEGCGALMHVHYNTILNNSQYINVKI